MDERIEKMIQGIAVISAANLLVGMLSSHRINMAPHQVGIGFSPFAGLSVVSDAFGILMQFYGMGIGLLWVNKLALAFFGTQLTALLPIGCVLRSFPWTRGAGAAMIALVVGFYVVYPLLVVLDIGVVNYDKGNAIMACNFNPGTWTQCLDNWFTEVGYGIVVIAILMPVFNLTITFTFTRELGRMLGGDIDMSALAKLL